MFSSISSTILFLLAINSLVPTVLSCAFHGESGELANLDYRSIIADNLAARAVKRRRSVPGRVAFQNVRIFNGHSLQPPSTLIIENGRIARHCEDCDPCPGAEVYDAKGMSLLPGFMDAHTHPYNVTNLEDLTRNGITTAANAACVSPQLCASLANHTGLTSLVMASFFATSPGSAHAKLAGTNNTNLLINGTAQVPAWVLRQVEQGANFIKVIGSAPLTGLSQDEQTALATSARYYGKQTVLHTSSYSSYMQGLIAGVDQIHHAPLDIPVDKKLLGMFAENFTIVCPTLTMMRAVAAAEANASVSFAAAMESVATLHKAGVRIIAGTDANMVASGPATVPYGTSLHDELENLVAAGMTPVEALNAATKYPTRYFGLNDRGSIEEGMRADLVLINGDPTANISTTRNIARVWVGGIPFEN